jgi:peptidoglycan/LPS O-acetylase OafA/YrhL
MGRNGSPRAVPARTAWAGPEREACAAAGIPPAPSGETPTPYTVALPLFGLFFTCVACGNSLGGLLRTRGALLRGECSYGIYLLHGLVLSVLFTDAAASIGPIATDRLPALTPLAAIAVTLITPVTCLLVERPAMRAGSRLAKLWTGRPPGAAAPGLKLAP